MKKYNQTNYLVAFMLMMLLCISNVVQVSAQDSQAKFQLDLGIQLDGADVIEQTDYVFEIIQRDDQGQAVENAQVVRYDKTDPNHVEDIQLTPGTYTFRLYDGTQPNFTRDGKPIRTKIAKESVVNPQEGEEPLSDILDQGTLNDWGNGTIVYDWTFKVTPEHAQAGEYLLQIVLADEFSLAMDEETTTVEETSGEASATTTSQESTISESTEVETTLSETTQAETTQADQPTTTEQSSLGQGMVELPFKVLDNAQTPVEGVVIRVNDEVASTDSQGNASVIVPAGTLQIAITEVPQGYDGIGAFDPITVESGSVKPIELSVNKLAQTQAVTITVLDEQNQAVENVGIQLADQELATNAQGQVTFNDVAVGEQTYVITSQPAGYHTDAIQGTINVESEQATTLDLTMTKEKQTGSLRFTVQDERGQTIEGLGIVVNDQEYISDSQGNISINDLPKQIYDYSFSNIPEGYQAPQAGQVSVQAQQEVSEVVTLKKIVTDGQVKINLQDQDKKAVANAVIKVADQSYTTDENGQIKIEALPAGSHNYLVDKLPEGYKGQVEDVVNVEAGKLAELTLSVERQKKPGTITIKVQDEKQAAVIGAKVILNQEQEVSTNDQGLATFSDLAEGSYQVEISSLPEGYSHTVEPQTIQITEGKTEERQLTVEKETPQRQLSVFIHDQNNQPVENVELKVADQTLKTNAQGKILFKALKSGTLDYTIVSVPDKYQGEKTGQVIIPEEEDASLDITIEKDIKPAKVQVNVTDQTGQVVTGAEVKFGGLTATTNNQGQIVWDQLAPGNYNYQLTKVPEGYKNTTEASAKELKEAEELVIDLQIKKLPDTGTVKIKVVDTDKKPVANAELEINGQTVKTDDLGIASLNDIDKGDQEIEVVSTPKNYQQKTQSQTINVRANQTVNVEMMLEKVEDNTQESSDPAEDSAESESEKKSTDTTETEKAPQESEKSTQTQKNISLDIEQETLSPQEEQKVSEEAKKATRQFKDPDTGIEVWINPQDAGKADHLVVKKLQPLQSLASLDADAYEISLQDENNQLVNLSKVAEVKLPTRPVNSQLKVIRVDGQDLSSLTFALQNQRTTFRTQKLGTFAISYGSKEKAQASTELSTTSQTAQDVKVSKTKGVDKKNLPGTGETTSNTIYIAAIILVGLGFYLWKSAKKTPKD